MDHFTPDLGEQLGQIRHLTEQAEAEVSQLRETLGRIADLTRAVRRRTQLESVG